MTLSYSWDLSKDEHGRIVKIACMGIVALAVFLVDRLTKYLVLTNLGLGQSFEVAPNIFHITLVFNKGAAFGLFKDFTVLFAILSAIVVAFIVYYIWKTPSVSMPVLICLGFISGGAAGNLLDRVLHGYVIDFLDFRVWPVFNMADSFITTGTILLSLVVLLRSPRKRKI